MSYIEYISKMEKLIEKRRNVMPNSQEYYAISDEMSFLACSNPAHAETAYNRSKGQ